MRGPPRTAREEAELLEAAAEEKEAAGRGQFVRADEHASLSVTILQALFGD